MSLEQKEHDDFFKKKREKKERDENQEFFQEKKIKLESAKLLQKLASEIAQEFWLDQIEVQSLIESQTHNDLEGLQQSFTKEKKTLLADRIKEAGSQIETLSKKHREHLKQSLEEENFEPEKHIYTLGKGIFWDKIYKQIEDPKKLWDHVIGLGLGIIDSSEALILFLYGLSKWILMTPYHLYLMIYKKAKYK